MQGIIGMLVGLVRRARRGQRRLQARARSPGAAARRGRARGAGRDLVNRPPNPLGDANRCSLPWVAWSHTRARCSASAHRRSTGPPPSPARGSTTDPGWTSPAEWLHGGDTLLGALVESLDWQQGRRWMYDRMVDDPRLSRWYRPVRAAAPSGARRGPRRALEARYGVAAAGPAFNYYRDGRDSVAPHSDRELRKLDDTLVAILTLGARRPFLLKAKRRRAVARSARPGSGDLLVMGGRDAARLGARGPQGRAAPGRGCRSRGAGRSGRDLPLADDQPATLGAMP